MEGNNFDPRSVADLVKSAMEEKKALNIKTIFIGEISTVADYFVICSASNPSQMEAIVDSIIEKLGKAGVVSKKQEGNRNSGWILMDYGDVVVHVFMQEDRDFYNLERIWRDGKFIE